MFVSMLIFQKNLLFYIAELLNFFVYFYFLWKDQYIVYEKPTAGTIKNVLKSL